MDFYMKWDICMVFKKIDDKNEVWLKCDKKHGQFRRRIMYIQDVAQFFLEWEMFHKKLQWNSKHTFYVKYFFPPKILSFLTVLLKLCENAAR